MIAGGVQAARRPVPWIDPAASLDTEHSRLLQSDEGLTALFRHLLERGPTGVPSEALAALIALRSLASFKRVFRRLGVGSWKAYVSRWRLDCSANVVDEIEATGHATAKTFVTEIDYDEVDRRKETRVVDETNASNEHVTTFKYTSLHVLVERVTTRRRCGPSSGTSSRI